MIAIGMMVIPFLSIFLYRLYKTRKNTNFKEIWIDGLIVNLIANLIFLGAGYLSREDLFRYFSNSKINMRSHCVSRPGSIDSVYDCEFEIKNSRESELKDLHFALVSSFKFKNFNFVSCQPKGEFVRNQIVAETKANGESSCKYRITLAPRETLKLNLEISGDVNEPDPEILQ